MIYVLSLPFRAGCKDVRGRVATYLSRTRTRFLHLQPLLAFSTALTTPSSTMSAPATPTNAGGSEFPASSPLKKFKLVFLGEQSVGKTSLITRFVSLPGRRRADRRCMTPSTTRTRPRLVSASSYHSADSRHRLPLEDHVPRGQDSTPATVGHGRVSKEGLFVYILTLTLCVTYSQVSLPLITETQANSRNVSAPLFPPTFETPPSRLSSTTSRVSSSRHSGS